MNQKNRSLLIIDDDPFCHFICKKIAATFGKDMSVLTFTSPIEALRFIEDFDNIDALAKPLVIFLDINMPEMTGWELLAKVEDLEAKKKQLLNFYIISSSVSQVDRDLAEASPLVSKFFSKPITKHVFKEVFQIA